MRELLARLSCPLCGGTHGDTLLVVIDSAGAGTEAVRAQCVRCHLFWSFSLDGAWQAPEPLSGPGPGVAAGPISDDELIELHCLLRDFDGSFDQLIARTA